MSDELKVRLTDEHFKALMQDMGMDVPVRPLPCVRDGHVEQGHWRVRDVIAKMDEERSEFDAEIFSHFGLDMLCGRCESMPAEARKRILCEWADMQIANTSAIAALIGATQEEMDAAILYGNIKNRKKGRL